MTPFEPLSDTADFEAALAASEQAPVIVFKHSVTCPVSSGARRRMLDLLDRPSAPTVFEVVVQDARAVSTHIAEVLDVRHESPQALLIANRAVVYHTSHGRIQADGLLDAAQLYRPA